MKKTIKFPIAWVDEKDGKIHVNESKFKKVSEIERINFGWCGYEYYRDVTLVIEDGALYFHGIEIKFKGFFGGDYGAVLYDHDELIGVHNMESSHYKVVKKGFFNKKEFVKFNYYNNFYPLIQQGIPKETKSVFSNFSICSQDSETITNHTKD